MRHKQLLRDFLPPVLVRALKRSPLVQSKSYLSYSDAMLHCGTGYQEQDLVRVVVEKNMRLRRHLEAGGSVIDSAAFRTLVALGLVRSDSLNVLDFGGGGGAHYFYAKVATNGKINFRWNVVETEALANEAKRLEDGKLKFFSSIDAAKQDLGSVDLVFTSGALQYVPDPETFLQSLVDVGAKHIFVTRTALSAGGQKVIIQQSQLGHNGPGPLPEGVADRTLYYPATFMCKQRFEEMLGQRYEIKTVFLEDRGAYTAEGEPVDMYGYFATLRS